MKDKIRLGNLGRPKVEFFGNIAFMIDISEVVIPHCTLKSQRVNMALGPEFCKISARRGLETEDGIPVPGGLGRGSTIKLVIGGFFINIIVCQVWFIN